MSIGWKKTPLGVGWYYLSARGWFTRSVESK